eukprot:SAG22_NODE_1023_length_5990_cov_16.923782_7_plen_277_part_00
MHAADRGFVLTLLLKAVNTAFPCVSLPFLAVPLLSQPTVALRFVLTLESLLDHGADIAALDKYGQTALQLAAQAGHQVAVLALLQHGGCDLEAASKLEPDFKVFHVACRDGWGDVVEVLLAQGVDVGALDTDGRTGWQLAREHYRYTIIEMLKAAAEGGNEVLEIEMRRMNSDFARFVTQEGELDESYVAGHIADTEYPGRMHRAWVKKARDDEEGEDGEDGEGSEGGTYGEGGSKAGGSRASGSRVGGSQAGSGRSRANGSKVAGSTAGSRRSKS